VIPLLFINFLENIFKHGAEFMIERSYIDCSLQLQKGKLQFHVKNSYENGIFGVSLTIEKQMKYLIGDDKLKLGSFYSEIQRVKKKQLSKKEEDKKADILFIKIDKKQHQLKCDEIDYVKGL
jgi:hypothetical protein